MSASENSIFGLAKQALEGTPITTDAAFKYMLYSEGSVAPNNIVTPLDPEVGGGALLRDIVKTGVNAGGALSFIPRPATLGHLLHGIIGDVNTVDNLDDSYEHTFTMAADPFAAPLYTVRQSPGGLFGEQFQDMRVNLLNLSWRGADFVRGAVGFVGGLPLSDVSMATWVHKTYLDSGPQFLAPLGAIELPSGDDAKVLEGSFVAAANIPLDEQYIVGSYEPDGLDITSKSYTLALRMKISDGALYKKMAYNPAGSAAWAADVLKEADIVLNFASAQEAASGTPYSFSLAANGENQASGLANVVWTVRPLNIRAGRSVIMDVVGTFLADPAGGDPITMTLVNQHAAY